MSDTVRKVIEIPGAYARHLEEIACVRGVPESALIAEALEFLFEDFDVEQAIEADKELLRELEAELGPLPPLKPVTPMNPANIVSMIGVPIDSSQIRRRLRRKRDLC
jgi:hypothetical protein